MPSIAHQLLGQTRSAVLGALLLHPESSHHVRELVRLTGASAVSLHREVGRQVQNSANTDSPVYAELAGLADVLRDAQQPLGDAVGLSFVHGSTAAGAARPGSDVDVIVLGLASFAQVALALGSWQGVLRREVNSTVMPAADWARRLAAGDGFVRSVAASPRIWLNGDEHDLEELVEHQEAEAPRRHTRRGASAAVGD